jgi:hypothetical protein
MLYNTHPTQSSSSSVLHLALRSDLVFFKKGKEDHVN